MKEIFSSIFHNNLWGGTESVSGPGSSIHESARLIHYLPLLIELFEIRTMLDAPCGDFHWMQHVPLSLDSYYGVDIVSEIIEQNIQKYKKEPIQFFEKNIVQDDLPTSDLILCRDALVHFDNEHIFETLKNFARSKSTYLLTTHFPHIKENTNITVGNWRPLHYGLPPFSFGPPLLMIKESTQIKTMALWRIADLPLTNPS
ncbi:hypothetical protein SAMN03159341_12422 [Paenibacillus sp. 1_12]|uniref:class I SAM-dependent methyltransferase n=1 Tax=Paenibacillus sp. 1_12 TaxID=1566278 RepID=UPI0008EB4F40|nr:class I SAM-dependent methyltransferase [Paenibacillus sp. 1_12]SFM28447.1 hypothetical protein SAMN03159341_12422 [Paenibacillus sp. 1_12]